MALKKDFTAEERYGLSEEEYKLARKYLRAHKTKGALKDMDAVKIYELFLLGDSFQKLAQQFTHLPIGQIILTAALRGWVKDREKMTTSLQDRVRAKVVKSVLDQVDFLTSMMSVANTEHLDVMIKYIQDPVRNPKPSMRVTSIKEYKDVAETLYKIISGATTPSRGKDKPAMFEALISKTPNGKPEELEEPEEINITDMLSLSDDTKD